MKPSKKYSPAGAGSGRPRGGFGANSGRIQAAARIAAAEQSPRS